MMLRSQRQLSRQFWELFVALPEELQSEIMFKQMDIEGASMLRLVSPLFRDTFRLSDAIQYVDLCMSNLVDIYGKMDAVEVVLTLLPLLKLLKLETLETLLETLEVTIVLTEYAPPIDVFLQYSHILLNGLFAQLAQSVNGRYYTRYNYIHIVEMRTAKDVHIRIHIISNGGNGGNGGRRVTINGELIGLRISPTA